MNLSITSSGPRPYATDPAERFSSDASVSGGGLSVSRSANGPTMAIAVERSLGELMAAVVAGVDTEQLRDVLRLFGQEARPAVVQEEPS